jgi:hypothetical protein
MKYQWRIMEKVQDRRYKPPRWYVTHTSVKNDLESLEYPRERVKELNKHYARVGREFKLQYREIKEWEDDRS